MKTLILYCFCKDYYNKKLNIFLKNGIFNSQKVDFILIRNNDNEEYLDELNKYLYNNVWLYLRPNFGHDFGGWNDALFLNENDLKNNKVLRYKPATDNFLYTKYKKFIFLNDTIYGPFIPSYLNNIWTKYFVSKLKDNIGIVCVSVNGCNHPITKKFHNNFSKNMQMYYSIISDDLSHAQSFAYALSLESLNILMKYNFYKPNNEVLYEISKNKTKLIECYEIGMSCILRHEKKDIFSLRKDQGLIKYDKKVNNNNIWCLYNGDYPVLETIFVKQCTQNKLLDVDRYYSI